MTVGWNDYVGKYVAVRTMVLSSVIRIRTADRPEGPWSEEILIEGRTPAFNLPWIGSSLGHPELAGKGGRVELLTYTRGLGPFGNETRAVEIEFQKRQDE